MNVVVIEPREACALFALYQAVEIHDLLVLLVGRPQIDRPNSGT